MSRPSIALACIMKNEAENLPILIESVKDCFDEIHITDTGSEDGSVEIAEKLGAKVTHFKWVHDFAAARNFSFSAVKTDYTMWLDLDDSLLNPKEFIDFRDHVLRVADMWMATYHYSYAGDVPACSFSRERIIKNGRGYAWKYFLHEGLIHDGTMPVTGQYVGSWAVKHRRTAEDLEKDKNRNLMVFEKNLHQMDARMRYYLGKEYFEIGRPKDALVQFGEALKAPNLEPHDRVICAQYSCYALMQEGKFDDAMSIALTNLQLAPNRAEYLTIIADCQLKKGNPQGAVPYYAAAKYCAPPTSGGSFQPVFYSSGAYGADPQVALAEILFKYGDQKRGKEEAEDCFKRFGTEASKALLAHINENEQAVQRIHEAKPSDDIVITCPFSVYEWDADLFKTRSMGGSETAAIQMAYWIHKISGRPVKVFNPRKEPNICEGVEYLPFDGAVKYFQREKPFMHIAWRHNMRLTDAPTFLWCHDLFTPGAENTGNYLKHLCLTPFHERYVMAMQSIPKEKILITRNGILPEKFESKEEKVPLRFVFGSSPDRGLDRCIRVLKKVRETHPGVNLHVFYGIEHLDKYGLQDLRIRLKEMMDENKDWITYHGATEQSELVKWYKSAEYNVQPSDWIETSCISALELIACGVYPIFRKVGGVSDTLEPYERAGMASLVESNCVTEGEHETYVQEVLRAIAERRCERVRMNLRDHAWEEVAKEWLRDLPKLAYGDKWDQLTLSS